MMHRVFRADVIAGFVLIAVVVFSSLSEAGEPALGVKPGAKDSVKVELINEIPVRAVQFDLTGVKISQVRTTDRTWGFLAKFNEQNGKVILLSTAGDKIAPGKGAVLEVVCDKPDAASLSGVKIVGE
jgi:hypothetical protein